VKKMTSADYLDECDEDEEEEQLLAEDFDEEGFTEAEILVLRKLRLRKW